MKQEKTNIVSMTGELLNAFTFAYEFKGERFMTSTIKIERDSGTHDYLPLIVSGRLLSSYGNTGDFITVDGQLRTYNKSKNVYLMVFVTDCYIWTNAEYNDNYVSLEGFICKPVNKRITPKHREVAEVLLAVNRSYGKSDYIPCIVWGRNARFVDGLPVGTKIEIKGRLQSREYWKKDLSGSKYYKTTYEVSTSTINIKE